jgi:hypothetical protein
LSVLRSEGIYEVSTGSFPMPVGQIVKWVTALPSAFPSRSREKQACGKGILLRSPPQLEKSKSAVKTAFPL